MKVTVHAERHAVRFLTLVKVLNHSGSHYNSSAWCNTSGSGTHQLQLEATPPTSLRMTKTE